MSSQGPSVIRAVDVSQEQGQQVITVSLAGDVDLHHSPAVRNELIRLAGEKPACLIIDLAGVDYMDSSGVATLVEALQRVRRYGGRLALVAPNERVRSIFEIARLDSIFRIAANRQDALAQ